MVLFFIVKDHKDGGK